MKSFLHITSIKDIQELKESFELEGKLATGQDGKGALPKDFWPTYSAFANTRGGVIVLGIRERDRVFELVGIEQSEKIVTEIFNTANNPQKISVNLLNDDNVRIVSIEGKKVVVVLVPEATRKQRPVYLN